MKKILLITSLLLLTACQALTPNQTRVITSETLEALSLQLDTLEKAGLLEDEEEDTYQYMLLHAHDLLTSRELMIDTDFCPQADNKQECILEITEEIETNIEGVKE